MHSIEQFGKRVASQYIDKLELGIGRIAENPELLREERLFHRSLRFYRVEKHLLACETAIDGWVIILAVLHASMDIPSRLAELEPNLHVEVELLVKKLRGRGNGDGSDRPKITNTLRLPGRECPPEGN